MSLPPKLNPAPARAVTISEDHIISVLLLRRARGAILGKGLFSDPAWDILLELFAAKLGGRSMTLSKLAVAIETPASTTARWVAALKDHGLVHSTTDPARPDGLSLSLTADGASRMEHLVSRGASAFASIS